MTLNEALNNIAVYSSTHNGMLDESVKVIAKPLKAIKELFTNHIEFVQEKDRCYFKIKNSKGKEKSFTSYSFLDFWKEVLCDIDLE